MAGEEHETLEDDHMFRLLLNGMIGAGILHVRAMKESTTNDRVRNIFKQAN